jgi:hypothetical protein
MAGRAEKGGQVRKRDKGPHKWRGILVPAKLFRPDAGLDRPLLALARGPARAGVGPFLSWASLALALAALAALAAWAFWASPGRAWAGSLSPLTWECLSESSRRFRVPIFMLLSVLDVERGQVGRERANRDGSSDLGPMQINTLWLPRLRSLGLGREAVRDSGCLNVAVGAWLLRHHLARSRGRPFEAMGRYHSLRPALAARYVSAIRARYGKVRADWAIAWANAPLAARARGGSRTGRAR